MSQIDEIRDYFERLPIQKHLMERQMVGVLLDRIAALEAALRNLLDRLGRRGVMDSLAAPSPRMEVFEAMDEARALLEGEKPQ